MDRRAALLAFALLGLALMAALPGRGGGGPTYVAGEIAASAWTIEGSPYVLVGNATVPAGHTLSIGAGVVVRANRATGLTILGGLAVLGTAGQPVLFTANASVADPGFWVGVRAANPSEATLSFANIEGAEVAFTLAGGSATIRSSSLGLSVRGLQLETASATVVGTSISFVTQAGVYARGSYVSIQSSLFSNDYFSMDLGASQVLVENSTFLTPTIGDLTLDNASLAVVRASLQEGMVKFVDAASRFDVEGLLAVTVTDAYNVPRPGAHVVVEDNANGTALGTATTNAEGRAPGLVVRERSVNKTTAPLGIDFNPFTITADAAGFLRVGTFVVLGRADVTLALPADLTPPMPVAPRLLAVDEGTPVTLDASASSDNDPGFANTGTFRWSFPEIGVELAGVITAYTFQTPGAYDGVLTATDAAGNAAILTFTVQVRDTTPPTITIGRAPANGIVGETLVFDATATDNDPAFPAGASYLWRFTSGGETIERGGTSASVAFDAAGTWSVTFAATDASGNTASAERTMVIAARPTPPTPNPWPWIGGGAALLAAAIGLATERGKVGLFTLFLPLYTRIKDEEVLDQFTRGQIYGYIRVHPGDTYTDIKRNLALNNGTLTYHLDVLEREGLIRARSSGARKMFYSLDARAPDNGGGLHELQQRMLHVLAETPGAAVSDLAGVLGISRQLATYHARLLAQQGLVRLERRGVRLCAVPLGPKA